MGSQMVFRRYEIKYLMDRRRALRRKIKMSKRIKRTALTSILCIALLLAGCGGGAAPSAEVTAAVSETVSTPLAATVETMDTGALFSTRDMDASYDESAAVSIRLNGDSALCSSSAVAIDGGEITLLAEGVYILSGTLTEGQVVVDAGDGDKVQIVLSGADITSAASAAIYCREADKVFLTLAAGTENSLTNGGSFQPVDDSNIDAVVFSKTDLTLNGSGSLTVTSPGGHGIVSKDELTITGGSYTLTAARHGLTCKDSVAIAGGNFTITSGSDGIHAENADDAAKGFLCIADGSFTIDAQGDAISASSQLQIDGGSFALTAGGGSASATMKAGDTMQRPGFRDFSAADAVAAADATEDTASCKGIKADGALTVSGGSFDLDTADDAVHSGADVAITGGEWTIRTGDDGIHADAAVLIQAGNLTIPYCYEGVEGQSVTIDGGTLDITARDDGLNAAGGSDGSGTAYGFGRQDPFAVDDNCAITINGGEITIVSDSDCLDSNGSLTINGGTLKLTCSGNGNTAIDANGTYANNGGSITTNDGSESGTGGMGGGRGDMGGGKPFGAEKAGGQGMPREPGQQRPIPGAAA